MAKHLKLPNTFRTPKHQVGVRAVERKWPFDSVRRSQSSKMVATKLITVTPSPTHIERAPNLRLDRTAVLWRIESDFMTRPSVSSQFF
jgi:hypothetical protein